MHWNIYAKWYGPDRKEGDWHWKLLCIVYDTESLGVIERALQVSGQEIKIEKS